MVMAQPWERAHYLTTATNAIHHAVERRVLLIDGIVRIHQALLRWHLIGARLAMSHRCLRQRLLVYVYRRTCARISRITWLRCGG